MVNLYNVTGNYYYIQEGKANNISQHPNSSRNWNHWLTTRTDRKVVFTVVRGAGVVWSRHTVYMSKTFKE